MAFALVLRSSQSRGVVSAAFTGSRIIASTASATSSKTQHQCVHTINQHRRLHMCAHLSQLLPLAQGSVRFAHAQPKEWILRRNETQRTHKQRRNCTRTSDELLADVEIFVERAPEDKAKALSTTIDLLSDILVHRFDKGARRLTPVQLSILAKKIVSHCQDHDIVIPDAQSVKLFGVFLKSSESLATYLANSGIVEMGPIAVNTLVSSYTVTENVESLKKTLGMALDRGIVLRISRFSRALYFLVTKDIEAAYELLERSQAAGFSTYADLVAPIVWGLLNRKEYDFARKVLGAYLDSNLSSESTVKEGAALTTTFVNTALATYRVTDEYDKAKELFLKLAPTSPYRAYPTLLTSMACWAHEKNDLGMAQEIWKRMSKYGLLPQTACARVLATACATRQLDFADQVYSEVARQLERKTMELTGPLHAAVVEYYIHQDHFRKALDVFFQMGSLGLQPRLDCCVPLIKLMGLKQRYAEIWQMYEHLREYPQLHKAQLYEAMAKVLYHEQNLDKIHTLLRDMQTRLGRVDAKSYGILMRAIAANPTADPNLVVMLYKTLLQTPKQPTRIHLDALRAAAARIGDTATIAFADGEARKHLRS